MWWAIAIAVGLDVIGTVHLIRQVVRLRTSLTGLRMSIGRLSNHVWKHSTEGIYTVGTPTRFSPVSEDHE